MTSLSADGRVARAVADAAGCDVSDSAHVAYRPARRVALLVGKSRYGSVAAVYTFRLALHSFLPIVNFGPSPDCNALHDDLS